MKNLFILLIVALSASISSAKTYSPDMSWEELNADTHLKIEPPVVFMGHAIAYTFVCKDGEMLRTMKPLKQTKTVYIGKNQSKEIVLGYKYLYTPIHYTRTVSDCTYIGRNREVCKDKVISGTYPMTVNIDVALWGPRNDSEKFLFKKPYTVPNCQVNPQPN
ncbi:hypothetical protein [Bdellovibrio svalbardensis]|uniref:Uncharacterized protein n=1 Tax=Bdellovibrio svalbardensis TaxID=2972972 RepID=A0ABT6DG30_9BACT|nr:hypothetical protein [Bdellovibrio svalbardensis]MDG0815797.1 hypothetical protein [Bdellovibrio svalbardensis]